MNRFDKLLGKQRRAEVKYLDGEFQVISPGDYVVCALTQEPIGLSDLKYWSVERQEAYANASVGLQAQIKQRSG